MTTDLNKNKIYRLSFKNKVKFYNPFTWLGFLIRWIAKITYNHTAVLYYDTKVKEWFIQEAYEKGIKSKIWFISNCIKIYDVCAIQDFNSIVSDDERKREKIKSLEGKKYDYKGLLFYQLILNTTKKWIGKETQDNKYYCYEHVAQVFGFRNAYKVIPKQFDTYFTTIKTINLT